MFCSDTGMPQLRLRACAGLVSLHLRRGPASHPSGEGQAASWKTYLAAAACFQTPSCWDCPRSETLQAPTAQAQSQLCTNLHSQHVCTRLPVQAEIEGPAHAMQPRDLLQLTTWTLVFPNTLQGKLPAQLPAGLSFLQMVSKTPWKDVHTPDNLRADFFSQEFQCFDYTESSYHSIHRAKGNKVMLIVVVFSSLNG